jgi:hypothetical protein
VAINLPIGAQGVAVCLWLDSQRPKLSLEALGLGNEVDCIKDIKPVGRQRNGVRPGFRPSVRGSYLHHVTSLSATLVRILRLALETL